MYRGQFKLFSKKSLNYFGDGDRFFTVFLGFLETLRLEGSNTKFLLFSIARNKRTWDCAFSKEVQWARTFFVLLFFTL